MVGLINIASALTPDIRWRGHLLLSFEPVEAIRLFHAMALPFGTALLLVSPYLVKRRRRAMQAAIGLMLALGLFDLLKGLDFEETVITWTAAAVLYAGRGAFAVRHDPITLRSAVWRVPLLSAGALALAAVAAWVSAGHPSFATIMRETGDLLAWQRGPLSFEPHTALHHQFAWIPLGVHMLEIATLLIVAYVIFRPIAAPRRLPDHAARQRAATLVREHGPDTLAFFKLRRDEHYLFSADRRAFVGYRIENGVLLLSGDPVGTRAMRSGRCSRELVRVRRARGLRLGAVGASERHLPAVRAGRACAPSTSATRRSSRPTSSRSRAARSARCASRSRGCSKAGLRGRARGARAARRRHDLAELEAVVARLARRRARARLLDGDGLARRRAPARDTSSCSRATERARSAASSTSCRRYGRAAVSLSFMRRDRDTPNGLTEFLVVRAIELLRERGIEELSLNFAAFAPSAAQPGRARSSARSAGSSRSATRSSRSRASTASTRSSSRAGSRATSCTRARSACRAGLAAMWAEGQLPKPSLPSRRELARRAA